MYPFDESIAPQPQESLENYIKRLRTRLSMSQQQLATAAGIHGQSLGKLERGKTLRLNQKTKKGLAIALNIPEEYLDAVVCGLPVEGVQKKQYCPRCWKGGTNPDPAWTLPRAKHCYHKQLTMNVNRSTLVDRQKLHDWLRQFVGGAAIVKWARRRLK